MKTLALSTAIVTLASGLAFAQTAPDSGNPTTSTGQQQAPLAGDAAAPPAAGENSGGAVGEPAIGALEGTPEVTPQTETTPDAAMTEGENGLLNGGTGSTGGTMDGTTGTMGGTTGTGTGTMGDTPDTAGGAAGTMGDTAGGTMENTATSGTPPEGYEPVMMESLNAEMLMDATVYDAEDSSVGDISEVMPEQGMPEQVIVDVGGFLGIGAKPVSLNVSELTFYKQTDGEEVRGYTTMTEDQLTDLPEHEG